jgi:hypothetical protein
MSLLSEHLKRIEFPKAEELSKTTKNNLGPGRAEKWLVDNWGKIQAEIGHRVACGDFYLDIEVPENIVRDVYKVAKNQLEPLGYKITENIIGAGKPVGITIDWQGKVGAAEIAFNNGKGT